MVIYTYIYIYIIHKIYICTYMHARTAYNTYMCFCECLYVCTEKILLLSTFKFCVLSVYYLCWFLYALDFSVLRCGVRE